MSRPGEDVGGRLIAEAHRRADQVDVADPTRRSVHALGKEAGLSALRALGAARVVEAAQRVTQIVGLLTSTRMPFGLGGARDVIAAAVALPAALHEPHTPLDVPATAALEAAVFALARFAANADSADAATLNALTTGIAAHAKMNASDIPGSTVIADSRNPHARLASTAAAIEQRVVVLIASPQTAQIADDAPTLSTLLREGAAATPHGLRGSDVEAVHAVQARVRGSLDLLDQAARSNRIAIAPARLDEIYSAEDAFYVAGGGHALDRRAAFYADSSEGTGNKTGGELVDMIMGWFEDGSVRETLGIVKIDDIIKDPPEVADPSLLEEAIASAARSFLGLVPGYLGGLIGNAASALWDPPKLDPRLKAAQRSPAAPSTDIPLLGFNVQDRREISAVWAATEKVRKALKVDKLIAKPSTTIINAIKPTRAPKSGGPSLAHAFISELMDQLVVSMNVIRDQASDLRNALELVPPAGLAQMWASLQAGAVETAENARTELVMRWASVISAATNGLGENGTSGHGGTMEEMIMQPGAVQIDVIVRTNDLFDGVAPSGGMRAQYKRRDAPEIEMTAARINGLSSSGLTTLRAAERPLGEVAMQRSIHVTLVEDSGVLNPIGSFDAGPEGQLNIDSIDPIDLAKAATGKQTTWDLSYAYSGKAHSTALDGARAILAALGTTARLQGPR